MSASDCIAVGPAGPDDLPAIEAAYADACDAMRGTSDDIMWEMGVHPSREGLLSSALAGDLFWAHGAASPDCCLGAFVLNGEQGPGYDVPDWEACCSAAQVAVLHLLVVAPAARHQGVGMRLLNAAVVEACRRGDMSLRLDAFSNNGPGIALYRSFGFIDHGEFTPTYDGLGPVNVHLMEYVL